MSRKVFASPHLHVLEKFSSFVATHGFHTSHSFPPAEYIAEYYSESDRESLDSRGYATNAYKSRCGKSGTTTILRGARSRNNCEQTRTIASVVAVKRTWREARRQVTGRRGELTERPRHVRRRRGYRRTRAKSAALGRLRGAGVGRAVYPWRHIIRVNTK